MPTFDFDARTRSYSRKNALCLGMAAQLAYKTEQEARLETEGWGFSEFKFLSERETQAFFACNDQTILLSFRGTEPTKLKDWMTDVDIDLVGGPGGKVHEGFINALSYVWRDIWSFIRSSRGRRTLWVTGHSLGAALATLTVAKLRLEKDEPVNGLYTFGQPRTGDGEFARHFNADFSAQAFRYVHNNDIVLTWSCPEVHFPFDCISWRKSVPATSPQIL